MSNSVEENVVSYLDSRICLKVGLSKLFSQFGRGVVRAGATGAWAPVEIGQLVPGTHPENNS